jgi:glycosyltransferase involved in cell wall biosynthesis
MGAGLAVIASDIDGTRDALGTEYEFLFEAGNHRACAGLIISLLDSPEIRARLGTQNKDRVDSLFSPETMCRETIAAIMGKPA